MNKEIESLLEINETIITREQRKEHRTLRNDETVLLMNNIKIKEYIQELEFQNTALKAEHNHNIDKIKELEQKESILDKVTDKLKEDAREEEGYIKWLDERTQEISQPKKTIIVKSDYARSILNIIEGEKK